MGESIVEGTLTKWLKKPGDRVERDEPLFEISTDKVDTEVPSPAAGTLAEVLVQEGQTVPINTVVARIDESGAARVATPREEPAVQAAAPVEAAAPEPAKPAVEAAPEVAEPAAAEAVGPLSPLVRRMLREHNLDPRLIKGTGAGGRITKQDVEAYLAARAQAAAAAAPPETPAAAPPPPPSARPAVPAPPETPPSPPEAAPLPRPEAAKVRIEPMSIMRQKIAEHMIMSRRTSAHVTTIHRVDMTRVARMRERYKAEIQQRYGFSLTYLPFITRAAAQALRAYPLLNASIDGTNIVYHNEINIGIAVALENGLIVPVIRNADEKSVIGLQRAIVDLATRARSRQLKPDEVQGGTFSITNFGSYGSLTGTPIINQPQVAILGVGVVEKAPVVVDDDKIAIRSVCLLSLSFDHRLIDGALADQFMLKIKSVLENWSEEVL
jgi:2-oxoglutarate dehydrogenase E2 component (dihydrolipoamide succinyltransferase)